MLRSSQHKRTMAAVGLLALSASLYILLNTPHRHPQFGWVRASSAVDWSERLTRMPRFIEAHLPRAFLSYTRGSEFLRLDGSPMEWSYSHTNTGWLYFRDARGLYSDQWEFALTAETNFLAVSEIPMRFAGAADSNRADILGSNSTTKGFRVGVGQVLFARRLDDQHKVYLIKLCKQNSGKLCVDYCAIPR